LQLKENYSQQEKDNCFITKAAWLSVEINVHCLTALIVLISQGNLPSYALNTYLFSSHPCETTFHGARALFGTFSSITNFSVSQFLNEIEKISILNHVKSTEEADNVEYPLKFRIHHKNRHKERTSSKISLNSSSITIDNIEKIIIKAYYQAENIMDSLQLLKKLKENNLNITKLNLFVFHQLDLKSTVDFCYFNEAELQDSSDDTNNIQNDIENSETNLEVDCYDSDEDNSDDYHFTTSKEAFQGMKIFDKIDPSKQDNYFRIMINNKSKYLHKQTAARLLTTNKNCLSSDRLSRVQQTNKQK
ncbi:unnamed protein product, partial [Rotaria sp. Silwood1]